MHRTVVPLNVAVADTVISLIDAQVPTGTPFVLVRYMVRDVEQGHSLRLDLDKGVFLDLFDDTTLDGQLQRSASEVVNIIRRKLMGVTANAS